MRAVRKTQGAGWNAQTVDMIYAVLGAGLVLLQISITRLSTSFSQDLPPLDRPITRFVVLQMSAGLVYLAALLLPHRQDNVRTRLTFTLAVGFVLRAVAWPSQPILEDDFHRYLWDGATTFAGVSPYRFAPGEILQGSASVPERLRLEALSSGPLVAQINHPELTTLYPPVAQAGFALAHGLAPFNLHAWKAVLLTADLFAACFLLRLLGVLGLPQSLLAIYWWNPLVIKETYNSAHMDVLLVPLLLAALLCRIRRRPFATAGFLALATGVKLWPALLAPLFLAPWLRRQGWRPAVPATYATLTGVLLMPMISGLSAHAGIAGYTGNWEMNDAFFSALSRVAGLVPYLGRLDQDSRLLFLRLTIAASLGVAAALVAWRDSGRPEELVRGGLALAAALLLASPAQFPWYFLWMTPFLTLVPSFPLLALTALLPLYYLRFHFLALGDTALFDNGVVFLEWASVWLMLIRVWRNRVRSGADTRQLTGEVA